MGKDKEGVTSTKTRAIRAVVARKKRHRRPKGPIYASESVAITEAELAQEEAERRAADRAELTMALDRARESVITELETKKEIPGVPGLPGWVAQEANAKVLLDMSMLLGCSAEEIYSEVTSLIEFEGRVSDLFELKDRSPEHDLPRLEEIARECGFIDSLVGDKAKILDAISNACGISDFELSRIGASSMPEETAREVIERALGMRR